MFLTMPIAFRAFECYSLMFATAFHNGVIEGHCTEVTNGMSLSNDILFLLVGVHCRGVFCYCVIGLEDS